MINKMSQDAETYGHVEVMPACVHTTFMTGGEGKSRLFGNRQSIDICTEPDRPRRLSPMDLDKQACLPLLKFIPIPRKGRYIVRKIFLSLEFLESKFRDLMKITC